VDRQDGGRVRAHELADVPGDNGLDCPGEFLVLASRRGTCLLLADDLMRALLQSLHDRQ
jgi:hypothetical protein